MVTPVSICGYGVGGTDFSGEEFTIAGGVAVCGGATARCHRVQHIAS